MSNALFWATHIFGWPTLLSTFLSNKLFWELFLVIYSWEQFFEPSFERWNSFEHFFEHSQECTYSQEHFFEWIYSHECSFGHFLKGSRSTRTLMPSGQCPWKQHISKRGFPQPQVYQLMLVSIFWCSNASPEDVSVNDEDGGGARTDLENLRLSFFFIFIISIGQGIYPV